MNLTKAKEIIGDKIRYEYSARQSDEGDATKLLIEAANFILLSRVTTPGSVPTLLKGETP